MTEQQKLIEEIEKAVRELKSTATNAYLDDKQVSSVLVKTTAGLILNRIRQLKEIQK